MGDPKSLSYVSSAFVFRCHRTYTSEELRGAGCARGSWGARQWTCWTRSVRTEDSRAGTFPVELWVDGVVRYKFGELTATTESTQTVRCYLALKLIVTSGWIDCTVIDF
ncbi:unnamed protein product [Urochloa humidicola]